MSNLGTILKSRDVTLPTKVRLVKAMVFPVAVYGCESWTIKQAEHQRIDTSELWCWRILSRVSWTARRSNQSILKEINPEYSLEGLMLKQKLPILRPPDAKKWLIWKDPDERLKAGGEGATEDEMVGWHHQLEGHESEQAPGVGEGQGSLACCSPWGCKESDTTERLNWIQYVNAVTWLFPIPAANTRKTARCWFLSSNALTKRSSLKSNLWWAD